MGILKRKIFYYPGDFYHGDKVRFLDWASVITTLGQCHEPYSGANWFPGGGIADIDTEDEIQMIDEIVAAGRDRMERFIVDDENVAIHGGLCWLRKKPI